MNNLSPSQIQAPVLQAIRSKFHQMTQTQQQIARYILDQPARVLRMSISELTQATDVKSESAVVRFYKILGFGGYNDFRVNLATEIAGKSFYSTYDDITATDDVETINTKMLQGIMRILHENMATIHPDALRQAVDVLEQASRIVFLGYGTAGIVGFDGFFKFSELGIICHYSPDPHVNAVILTEPKEGGLHLLFRRKPRHSDSGESR